MMPVIRISDRTWERLKKYARPLEDSPEDIVRIALDALEAAGGRPAEQARESAQSSPPKPQPRRTARGGKLPQREFRDPLLQVLRDQGGKASVKVIRELLKPKMAPRLGDADYQPVSSGDPRWWNAVCWERNSLVQEGLLRHDSERGVWELSPRAVREMGRSE